MIEMLNFNVNISVIRMDPENASETVRYLTRTRNRVLIPAAVRRASLCVVTARLSTNAGPSFFFFCPKDVLRLIVNIQVFGTRNDSLWIQTVEETVRQDPKWIKALADDAAEK